VNNQARLFSVSTEGGSYCLGSEAASPDVYEAQCADSKWVRKRLVADTVGILVLRAQIVRHPPG
jgi:hypothetical protein